MTVLAILTFILATMFATVAIGSFACVVLSTVSLIVSPFTKQLSCGDCLGAFGSSMAVAFLAVPLGAFGVFLFTGATLQSLDPLHSVPNADDLLIALGCVCGLALAITSFLVGMAVKAHDSMNDLLETLVLM